jgi:hypothetical protein
VTRSRLNYESGLSSIKSRIEEEWRIGRLEDDDDIAAMLKRALGQTRRQGFSTGAPVRTFHLNVKSFKAVASRRARSSSSRMIEDQGKRRARQGGQCSGLRQRIRRKLSYIQRTGGNERHTDLLAVGGSPVQAMLSCGIALAVGAARSNANIFYTLVMELPQDTDTDRLKLVGDRLMQYFANRLCPATYAIHDRDQPHLHLVVAARPCREISPGYWVAECQGRMRFPGFRLFNGRAAMREFRGTAADMINEICQPGIRFHPGRRPATGLNGAPERRLGRADLQRQLNELKWFALEHVTRLRNSRLIDTARTKDNVMGETPGIQRRAPEAAEGMHRRREPDHAFRPAKIGHGRPIGEIPIARPDRPSRAQPSYPISTSSPGTPQKAIQPAAPGSPPNRGKPTNLHSPRRHPPPSFPTALRPTVERPPSTGRRPKVPEKPASRSPIPASEIETFIAISKVIWRDYATETEEQHRSRLRTMPRAELAKAQRCTKQLIEFYAPQSGTSRKFQQVLEILRHGRRCAVKVLAEPEQPTARRTPEPSVSASGRKRPGDFER